MEALEAMPDIFDTVAREAFTRFAKSDTPRALSLPCNACANRSIKRYLLTNAPRAKANKDSSLVGELNLRSEFHTIAICEIIYI